MPDGVCGYAAGQSGRGRKTHWYDLPVAGIKILKCDTGGGKDVVVAAHATQCFVFGDGTANYDYYYFRFYLQQFAYSGGKFDRQGKVNKIREDSKRVDLNSGEEYKFAPVGRNEALYPWVDRKAIAGYFNTGAHEDYKI